MNDYDREAAKKTSERMKKRWRDPAYRARMAEVARKRKRCTDCGHVYTRDAERWLSCRVKISRVLTGGEFACGDSFKEKDEKV